MVFKRTLFDLASDNGMKVPSSCRRNGKCHECIVEVSKGIEALGKLTKLESFLKGNYRLACQATIDNENIQIKFSPLTRRLKILTEDQKIREIDLNPSVRLFSGKILYEDLIIDDYRGGIYGLAIDLGTTSVLIDLINLQNGYCLDRVSLENPQRFGGSDVMNRISYDMMNQGELKKAIVNTLNREIRNFTKVHNFTRSQIYEILVAGNSTMRDILFGIEVESIGQKPYKSLTEIEYLDGKRKSTELTKFAWDLGIRANRETRIYSLPLIASHVGADTSACLAAINMNKYKDECIMLVDVGTNTEVVIGNKHRMIVCSCPAGPAFEGGIVKFGMPGCEGAIESIKFNTHNDTFTFKTIGNITPQGICGSGLIDLIAELRRNKIMTEYGVFHHDKKKFEINIVPEQGITFSRSDASILAQATAANFCGQFISMKKYGINPSEVSKFFLAGGFANYVNIPNAIEIGFLPPVPLDKIIKIGNASISGARRLLLSKKERKKLSKLLNNVQHIELESTPDFFNIFVEGCQFKPMPDIII